MTPETHFVFHVRYSFKYGYQEKGSENCREEDGRSKSGEESGEEDRGC